jgi:hypothetical protein
MAATLMGMKILNTQMDVMLQHAPMFVIASVLIVSGVQMLAIGLLGELGVRHFYTGRQRTPYSIESMLCLRVTEKPHVVSKDAGIRE